GLRVNEMLREAIIADPSKLATLRDQKALITDGLAACYLLARQTGRTYVPEARQLFNRSKAILFGDRSVRHRLRERMTPADQQTLRRMELSLRELHDRRFDTGADRLVLEGAILDTLQAVRDLFDRYPHPEPMHSTPDAYVEYAVQSDWVYALGNMQGREQFVRLGSYPELLALINRLNTQLRLKSWGSDEAV